MRLALGVSYNGQPYLGWQSQPSGQTIQDQLEKALSQFCDQRVLTHCAGRTDTGVHGLMQVVHLDTPLERDMHSWVRGTNRYLPSDIAVQWVREVPDTFHARGNAVARRYVYVLLESAVRPALESGRVGWSFRPLDEVAMREAAQHLLGEHDFSSFRASACQALSPVKTLHRIDISCRGPEMARYWRFEFEGNAFLHHMIRNIMGCLGLCRPGHAPAQLAAQGDRRAQPRRRSAHLLARRPVFRRPGLWARMGSAHDHPGF